jgi:hypothetical protein
MDWSGVFTPLERTVTTWVTLVTVVERATAGAGTGEAMTPAPRPTAARIAVLKNFIMLEDYYMLEIAKNWM